MVTNRVHFYNIDPILRIYIQSTLAGESEQYQYDRRTAGIETAYTYNLYGNY